MRTAVLAASVFAIAAPIASSSPVASTEVAIKRGEGTGAAALPGGVRSLFPRSAAETLRRRAEGLGQESPDLRRWYRLTVSDPEAAGRVAKRIRREGDHDAHVIEPPAPPPTMCRPAPEEGWPSFTELATPDLTPLQDYREGLGIPVVAGVDAAGVEIATVEYSWDPEHEAIRGRSIPEPPTPEWSRHGTAVLSVLGGNNEEHGGVRGLLPDVELSPRSPILEGGSADVAGAIVSAAADLAVGDVLLIEQQAWAPGLGSVLGPVELDPAVRDAVEAVVASGVIVVEPAGNNRYGGWDLAELGVEGDSGAIVVGAGGSPRYDENGHRAHFSNHGRRVDFHSQGEGLVAAGYGDLTPGLTEERHYTACFGGTSGAAAIVAAAAAGVQGAARARSLEPLSPEEIRERLAVEALPQHDPENGLVGPSPWLTSAADFVAPPSPAAIAPAPGSDVTGPSVALRWETEDEEHLGAERVNDEVRVDGEVVGQVAPGVGALDVTLPPGRHEWVVRAADAAGNASEMRAEFAVVGVPDLSTENQGNDGPDQTSEPSASPNPSAASPRSSPPLSPPVSAESPATIVRAEARPQHAVRPSRIRWRKAAQAVASSWRPRDGRLVLRFRGLATAATVRVAGATVRLRGSAAVLTRLRPGRVRVTVTAHGRGAVRYRPARFSVRLGPKLVKRSANGTAHGRSARS